MHASQIELSVPVKFLQRFAERGRNGSGFKSSAVPAEAGDLLFAFGGEFFAAIEQAPIFVAHGDAVLRHFGKGHADEDFVESVQFGKIFAGAAKGREGQSAREVVEN